MSVFNQIHEIVFWGQGGYSYDVIYDMPVWLRKFTFSQLKQHYEKQNGRDDQETNFQKSIAAMKQAKIDNIIPSQTKNPPKKQPTYTTKASKK